MADDQVKGTSTVSNGADKDAALVSYCPQPGLARNGMPISTATTPPVPRERPNATLVIR